MDKGSLVSEFLSLVDIDNYEARYKSDILNDRYFGMPLKSIIESERRLRSDTGNKIAYFSMEYGLAASAYNIFKSNIEVNQKNQSKEQEVFSNPRNSVFCPRNSPGIPGIP